MDNPLLRDPLAPGHIKPRLLGHSGPTPGLNLVYAYLNRIIRDRDVNVIYITGPGHGGPGLVANAYLEGTYSEVYSGIEECRRRLAKVGPPVLISRWHSQPRRGRDTGILHEGGELGYAPVHVYGAAFDNPDLVVACVIGDGEAEPAATNVTGTSLGLDYRRPISGDWGQERSTNAAADTGPPRRGSSS